jgi:DNA-binding transcriptional LysR family regulator
MELRDIEYFAVVAEHRHLGRAAEALGLTQPALSKSLRRLEQALGAKLVKRTPKGIALTVEGAALESHVHKLRLSLADVAHEISDLSAGRTGQLRVGAGPGFVEDLLQRACSVLMNETPNVTLTVTVAASDMLFPALQAGNLDLMISGIPVPPFDDQVQERLLDEQIVVFAASGHRLAKRSRVAIADIARERWALTTINPEGWMLPQRVSVFETAGLRHPSVAIRTSYLPLRDQMVSRSNLLGLSSRRYLSQIAERLNVVELAVPELTWKRTVGISYRKNAYLSPAARRFIAILKAVVADIATELR